MPAQWSSLYGQHYYGSALEQNLVRLIPGGPGFIPDWLTYGARILLVDCSLSPSPGNYILSDNIGWHSVSGPKSPRTASPRIHE